jgi:hypothetical protein
MTSENKLFKSWTYFFGSERQDDPYSLAIGIDGAIYVAGYAGGSFDGQANNGNSDGFITKIDNLGNRLWTRIIGIGSYDIIYSTATSRDNFVYVAGSIGPGSFYGESGKDSPSNSFLSKLDSDGNMVWNRLIGAGNYYLDNITAISTSGDGYIYVTGWTTNSLDGQSKLGLTDGFLIKFNPNGTKEWTRLFGSNSYDYAYALTTDSDGHVYIAGQTKGAIDDQPKYGQEDAFLIKFQGDGTKAWSRTFGSELWDSGNSIALDAEGGIYVSGFTDGNFNGFQNMGGRDGFIAKFTSDGLNPLTIQTGSMSTDYPWAIAIDDEGNIFQAGEKNHGRQAFLSKYNETGDILWNYEVDAGFNNSFRALAFDESGALYSAGFTTGSFDGHTNIGSNDAFLQKWTPEIRSGISGKIYHWKSHALLDKVSVQSLDYSLQSSPLDSALEFRNLSINSETGRITMEVWIKPSSNIESFDFTAYGPPGSVLEYSSSLDSNWSTLSNSENTGQLLVGAFLSTFGARGLTDPAQVGTLTTQLAVGSNDVRISFSDVKVGEYTSPNFSIGIAGATTDANGDFSFASLPAGSSRIIAARESTDGSNGVTSADALAALRLAVGVNPNIDPDGTGPLAALKVSPYQLIAADANQDGKVTSADALAILRMAVKLTTAVPQEWFFVEETRDLWNEGTGQSALTRTNAAWSRAIEAQAPGDVSLVGVLKGDVNGSWTAPTGAKDLDDLKPGYFADLSQRIGAPMDQFGVYSGG